MTNPARRAELLQMVAAVVAGYPADPEKETARMYADDVVGLAVALLDSVGRRLGEQEDAAQPEGAWSAARDLSRAACDLMAARARRQWLDPHFEKLEAAVEALDPYFEDHDPRAMGWVDDRGRP